MLYLVDKKLDRTPIGDREPFEIDHRRLNADLLAAEVRTAGVHLGILATGPRRLR